MNVSDSQLLRAYLRDGSEESFAELLRRHVDLVYSAARRQVDDDHAAEEVTQLVFTDLARKAESLSRHPILTGWLYTSARLAATQHRRSTVRRLVRETTAHTMDQLLTSADSPPAWDELGPVLDDVMHQLKEPDREAVLLRYFERRPLADIGNKLGISENTARMRIERALDQLRAALAKRGITSTAAALGTALSRQAVSAAPASLLARLSPVASLRPLPRPLPSPRRTTWGILAVATLVLMTGLITRLWLNPPRSSKAGFDPASATAQLNDLSSNVGSPEPVAVAEDPVQAGAAESEARSWANEPQLVLQFLAQDSGKPIPNVAVDYRGWSRQGWGGLNQRKFTGTRDGRTRVFIATNTFRVELTSRAEGFADTQLLWDATHGDLIPTNSVVIRLDRGVPLGGMVVDANFQPVAGAMVGFNLAEAGFERTGVESHEFGWSGAQTDASGHWSHTRIAADVLNRVEISASHPEHQASRRVLLAVEPLATTNLLDGTHVLRLTPAITIQGVVVDDTDQPIANATVTIDPGTRRKAQTEPDGSFSVPGCPIGEQIITVSAPGFAAATRRTRLEQDGAVPRVVLHPAQTLRFRVVDRAGKPIGQAWFGRDWYHPAVGPRSHDALAVRAEFAGETDEEGRAEWTDAPRGTHQFSIGAAGFLTRRGVVVPADGGEHLIILDPALTVHGTVTDAATGDLLPSFRIALGWPEIDYINGRTNARFSPDDASWQRFQGGRYAHSMTEPVNFGDGNPRVVLMFQADGFRSSFSRVIGLPEGDVEINAALEPARTLDVTVRLPDGRPAAGVEVGLTRLGDRLYLNGTRFSRERGLDPTGFLRTDAQGRFKLVDDSGIRSVLVAHADGFAEATFENLIKNPELRLEGWARIEGELVGRDSGARSVFLHAPPGATSGVEIELTQAQVEVDARRRFAFDHVPPGDWQISQTRPVVQVDGSTMGLPGQTVSLKLTAGEVGRVQLGGGYRVTGRLRVPPGFEVPANAQWLGRCKTLSPEPPAELSENPGSIDEWRKRPEIAAQLKSVKFRSVAVSREGEVMADSLEPGEYRLLLDLMVLSDASSSDDSQRRMQPLLVAKHSFTVPADTDDGELDLGVISAESPVER